MSDIGTGSRLVLMPFDSPKQMEQQNGNQLSRIGNLLWISLEIAICNYRARQISRQLKDILEKFHTKSGLCESFGFSFLFKICIFVNP